MNVPFMKVWVSHWNTGDTRRMRSRWERMAPIDEWVRTVDHIVVNEPDNAALVAFHITGRRKGKLLDRAGSERSGVSFGIWDRSTSSSPRNRSVLPSVGSVGSAQRRTCERNSACALR